MTSWAALIAATALLAAPTATATATQVTAYAHTTKRRGR